MSSKRLDFRDFVDEKDVVCGDTNVWKSIFIGPEISAEEFEFSLKIHQLANLVIGVMKPDHPKNTYFGQQGGIGWGWQCLGNGGGYSSSSSTYSYVRFTGTGSLDIQNRLKPFKVGNIVRFVINKKDKTIHVNKNDEQPFRIYENVDFPEKLHISCSCYCESKIELISYIEGGEEFEEETNEEENERITSIVENFGNLKIPLLNKELSLWKCFLINSSIRNLHQISEYQGLNDLKLNVDEKIILMIILQKKVDISSDNLLDYFLLFKRLGLKREMKQILDRLSQINSFEEGYQCFKRLCKEQHENDTLQSWFRFENRRILSEITIDTFDTSFGLSLFNILKDKESELSSNHDLMILDLFIAIVIRHIRLYDHILDPLNHVDFQNVNLDDLTVQKVFNKLNNHLPLSNVKLVSTEGEEFTCHRELLVYRFGHFQRMFEFDGIEREALLNNEPIKIMDMNNSVLSSFLNYVYTEEIDSEDIVVVITLFVIGFKYLSPKLKTCSFEKLKTITNKKLEDNSVLDEVLERVGHLLDNNDEVSQIVVPLLTKWSNQTEEMIINKIRESYEKEVVEERMRRIDDLEKEVEEIKREMKRENEEIKREMKRENEEIKKEMIVMKEQIRRLLEERQ